MLICHHQVDVTSAGWIARRVTPWLHLLYLHCTLLYMYMQFVHLSVTGFHSSGITADLFSDLPVASCSLVTGPYNLPLVEFSVSRPHSGTHSSLPYYITYMRIALHIYIVQAQRYNISCFSSSC